MILMHFAETPRKNLPNISAKSSASFPGKVLLVFDDISTKRLASVRSGAILKRMMLHLTETTTTRP